MRHLHPKSNGHRLHVSINDDFKAGAITLFFAPGYHGEFDTWPNSRYVKTLENYADERDFNLVTYEPTGHGLSDGTIKDSGWGDYFRDGRFVFNRFCDPERVGPVLLVGHSIGGVNIIPFAISAEQKNPGSIAGLFSASPTLSLMGFNGYATQILEDPERREMLAREGSVLSPLGEKIGMRYSERFLHDSRHLDLVYAHKKIGHNGSAAYVLERRPPLPEPLPFHMTFMIGANDPASPQQDAEDFVGRLADGNAEIITRLPEPHPNGKREKLASHDMSRDSDMAVMVARLDEYVEAAAPKASSRPAFAPQALAL